MLEVASDERGGRLPPARALLAADEPVPAADAPADGPSSAEIEEEFGPQPAPPRLRAPAAAARRPESPPRPAPHAPPSADSEAQRAVDASLDTMAHRMYAPSLVLQQSLEYAAPGAAGKRLFGVHDPLPRVLVQATRLALGLAPEQQGSPS